MRLFWILLVVPMLSCDGCGDNDAPPPQPQVELGPAENAPIPGAIYKEALERAKQEITADNAADRLDEIERAIDRGEAKP